MSLVDIDDLDCPFCKRITQGELNIKRHEYTCFRCGKVFE